MKTNRKHGFTVVELVVVIAIIAVLAAVLIPTFTSIVKKANDSAYLQERTNQQIADLAEKVEKINYFTWEDFEKKLAEELAKVDTTGLDEAALNTAVTSAVTEAMKEYSAHSQASMTGLTAEQVKKIVDEAMAGQLTTAQVEAIVKAAVGNKTVDVNAIANQVIAKLPKTTGITKEEMQKAINEALNGVEGVTEADIAKALAAFGVSTLTEADINSIISSATADNTTLAKALNIRLANLGIGKQKTVYDMVVKIGGESVITGTNTTSTVLDDTSTLLYDLDSNKFFTVKNNVVDYDGGLSLSGELNEAYKYWIFANSVNTTYSTYLLSGSEVTSAEVTKGIDVGYKTDVTIITYDRSTETSAQDVVIRTNSASTTLTINAANDNVSHYGKAGEVKIINVATASYHEFGNVVYLNASEIEQGNIVFESGADVEILYCISDSANVTFELKDGASIDHAHTTSADLKTSLDNASTNMTWDYDEDGTTVHPENSGTWNVAENVIDKINEAKAPEIAKELEEETTAVVYNLTTGEYYDNLYSAIESVPVNIKTTLVLLKNINGVSNKNYQIDDNQIIVFDLNGHTMNTVAPDGNTAYAIENKGTLTIKDNSDTLKNGTGKGKLELNALYPDLQAIPGYASNLITNMGNLTVESGWLYNASTGTAAYAIDLNSNNGRNVSLIVNGGKITTNASLSIRQQVHTNTTNDVTINGGIIGSFWIQNYGNSSTSANGNLNINGGEFLYKIRLDTGYSIDYEYDIKAENVRVNINGGTFNGTITVYENGNNGQFTIFGGTFNKEITYYGEVKFIRGGTFNVSPVLKSDGYPYATVDGGGFGFYNLTDLLNSAGTTLEDILSLDLETQIDTYGFGLEYWESPSIVNKQYGGSDCYDVVRYVTPSYDEYINDGFIAINNNDGTITVVAE